MNFLIPLIAKLVPAKARAYFDGKKTYILAAVAGATAVAQALGYHVPDWAYALEGALGIGAVRVAISKSNGPYQTGTP